MSGPVWPGGYTWASKFITLYTFVIALINLGNEIGGLVFQWVVGYLLHYCDDVSVMYFTSVMSLLLLLLCIVIHVLSKYRPKHRERLRLTSDEEDDLLQSDLD